MSIRRLGVLVFPSANPRSMRVRVVGDGVCSRRYLEFKSMKDRCGRAGRKRRPSAVTVLAGRITVTGSAARARPPWDGLAAEFRQVILNLRPCVDAELIERACNVAARCHQGQLHLSGDPYITHPVAVATILARLGDAGGVEGPGRLRP